jgi:hypothetical protein
MDSTQRSRVIAAGMIGNVLEWYDFVIYGYFAAQIGRTNTSEGSAQTISMSSSSAFRKSGGLMQTSTQYRKRYHVARSLPPKESAKNLSIGNLLPKPHLSASVRLTKCF